MTDATPSPPSPFDAAAMQRLEELRAYLMVVAAKEIPPHWQAKIAASDMVQQTLIEAAPDAGRMREASDQDLQRWLRRILTNNLLDAGRKLTASKRAIGREVDGGKSAILKKVGIPGSELPEAMAMRREQAAALDLAIDALPPQYRLVIHLRHRDGLSFDAIAERLSLTSNAAQKLWARALEALREQMNARP